MSDRPQTVNACSLRVLLAVGGIALFFVIMVIVAMGLLGGIAGKGQDKGTAGGALYQCEKTVRGRLVAPSTAKFSPLNDTTIWETNQPGDNWGVLGYVDSQNRLGAMVRMHYLCIMRYDGNSRWVLTELDLTDR